MEPQETQQTPPSPPDSTWLTTLLPIMVIVMGVLYVWSITGNVRREMQTNAMQIVEEQHGPAALSRLRAEPGRLLRHGWSATRAGEEHDALYLVALTFIREGVPALQRIWWEVDVETTQVQEVTGNPELEARYLTLITPDREAREPTRSR